MANVNQAPNANPANRAKRDDKNFHYVNAEKPGDRFPEDTGNFMLENVVSPTDPTKMMYELHSKDVRDTGDARHMTLRCSVEDYKAKLAENDKYTRTMLAQPDPSGADEEHRSGVARQKRITQGDDVILS